MSSKILRISCLVVAWSTIGLIAAAGIGLLFFGTGISSGQHEFLESVLSDRANGSPEHFLWRMRAAFLHWTIMGLVLCAGLFVLAARTANLTTGHMVALLISLPVVLVSIYFASGLVVLCAMAIEYPYQWDYGEGNILDIVESLKQGLPIYTPFDQPPYTVVNYPPVFMIAVVAFQKLVPITTLAAGRLLSCLSTLTATIAIICIILRVVSEKTSKGAPIFAGVAGGIVFLSVVPVWGWAPLMRVDMLAAMFSGLGLLFFLKAESKSEWVYVSIMMFVLAGFTRQSSIALPMACFVMAVFRRPGMAIRFAGGIGCGAAIGFVVLNWITGGSFYQHVIVANASHEFSWSRAVEWIVGLFRLYPLFFSIAFIGAVMALRDFGRSLAAQREDPTPIVISKGDASWGKPLLGWAWLFAFAVSLTIGKTASNINYFIDFMMVTAILLGVSTASVWGKFQKTNPARFGRVGTTTAIVVAIILVWLQVSSTSGLAQRMNGYARTLPGGRVRLETREVVARIEFAAGDVLSTDHTLLALAGKRIFFETRDMRRFYDNGLVDPAPMVEMVHETRFPLIVVRNRTHSDLAGTNPGRSRYVQEMTEQIKENYELVWKGESYFIYERKRDSARKRFAQ